MTFGKGPLGRSGVSPTGSISRNFQSEFLGRRDAMIAPQAKIGDPVYVVIDYDDEVIGVHVSLVSAKAALESIVEQHGGSVEPKESWQADFVRYTASTNAGNFLGIVIEKPLSH